ncbi:MULTISPECIES: N-acetylmuramoyl-L-alanine amidase [unclassified Streptomyces]|uniref:N-acetylmuramoyl-L-alanine amidase n=1 Tax=unclassified Streptomyces TaxID=2593676 RepID=UPI002E16D11F|nr:MULTISPECIES: N-acetylmuramoyl-L-alanine amidase [unclassified Streptomyces]
MAPGTRRGIGVGVALAAVLGATVILVDTETGRRVDNRAGRVDQPSADWIAASDANYRSADRPNDQPIDRIVVHVTQSRFDGATTAFRDAGHGAAAHYVVRAADGHLAQTVREADVAYHAGNWAWNARSVGIEHEGFVDDPDRWFTDAAYRASARLAADISTRYDIPVDREHIVGHNEVPGATHTDPGPYWDWDRYIRLVRAAK